VANLEAYGRIVTIECKKDFTSMCEKFLKHHESMGT